MDAVISKKLTNNKPKKYEAKPSNLINNLFNIFRTNKIENFYSDSTVHVKFGNSIKNNKQEKETDTETRPIYIYKLLWKIDTGTSLYNLEMKNCFNKLYLRHPNLIYKMLNLSNTSKTFFYF